jgi:putative acetyltransferase
MQIVIDDLTYPATRELLALHIASLYTNSPPGTCFALDISGLQKPEITVWTVRDGEAVLGIGALKSLPPDGTGGELKSMRTHPDHLRKGVARTLLEHIIKEAKARGMRRLSLETGTGPDFEATLALYRKRGFVEGDAFGEYPRGSGFNRFFHLDLVSDSDHSVEGSKETTV